MFACKNNISLNPDPIGTEIKLSRIEDVVNGNDLELKKLLNKVRGSVGKRGPGSKVIWSTKNDFSLGLYVSALHIIGTEGFATKDELYFNLFDSSYSWGIYMTSQMPPVDGNLEFGNTLIGDYFLYHPKISANATNTTIVPSEDFYIGVIDNQRVQDNGFAQYPAEIETSIPLDLYDPDKRTLAAETCASPIPGENAIAVGYPHDTDRFPYGAVAYGKILSDAEAEDMIKELKTFNDSEGDLPYNSQVEFLIKTQGISGMSGGGVFNNKGQLLGILTRASDADGAPKIVRVLRILYIKDKFIKYYNTLSDSEKNTIYPFMSGEL